MIPPAWLTRVVSLATEQGRDFRLRPLDQRERYKLLRLYEGGCAPDTAAVLLIKPRLGPSLLDGGPGRAA